MPHLRGTAARLHADCNLLETGVRLRDRQEPELRAQLHRSLNRSHCPGLHGDLAARADAMGACGFGDSATRSGDRASCAQPLEQEFSFSNATGF
jgi:hypothetical protein